MSYDKAVNSTELKQAIKSTADSIRAKANEDSKQLFWSDTDGFAASIDSLEFSKGEIDITEDGTYDVSGKATANVSADKLNDMLSENLTSYRNESLRRITQYGFYKYSNLVEIYTPTVINIFAYGLAETGITEYTAKNVLRLYSGAMRKCADLVKVDMKSALSFGTYALAYCTNLEALIIRGLITSEIPTLTSSTLTSTKIASGTGYIYVPSEYVEDFKAATNWSAYADQIRAIEDYPEITGGAEE